MTAPQPTHLSRDIARSDPLDAAAQGALLGRIRDLRLAMPKNAHSDLSANLEMAVMLTQYLIRLGGIGPQDVLQIISRLVGEVELAFTGHREVVVGTPQPAAAPDAAPVGALHLVGQTEQSRAKLLGEILLQLGYVRPDQVEQALRVQQATGARLGEILVDLGATTWERVGKAVAIQEQLKRALGA